MAVPFLDGEEASHLLKNPAVNASGDAVLMSEMKCTETSLPSAFSSAAKETRALYSFSFTNIRFGSCGNSRKNVTTIRRKPTSQPPLVGYSV